MKQSFLILFLLISCNFIFSQTDNKILLDTVVICKNDEMKAFHSDQRCVGLDTCKDSLEEVLDSIAIESFNRKPCCICWENVEKNCVNDNPNAYEEVDYDPTYEEDDEYEDDRIYVDDWVELANLGYATIGIALVSVVLLSNEVFVGTSYSYFPPKLSYLSKSNLEPSLGIDILFRKNFKHDALEYGFSYHDYTWQDERDPDIFDNHTTYIWSISYLHEMNRHFSSYKDAPLKFKFYVGPIVKFGYSDGFSPDDNNHFGVGGTMIVSLPLGKRFHLDLRNELTNYSSEVKFGIRWLYQRKYPWQKRRN